MKFRHVLVICAGSFIAILLLGIGALARYEPNHYKFLGSAGPKKVTLEPDRIGWVGREARYYVLHEDPTQVKKEAQSELKTIGWKQITSSPAVFGRGPHERIDVRSAMEYKDGELLDGIPAAQLSGYTVVKVVDPHLPPALRRRMSRWAHHPFKRIFARFA